MVEQGSELKLNLPTESAGLPNPELTQILDEIEQSIQTYFSAETNPQSFTFHQVKTLYNYLGPDSIAYLPWAHLAWLLKTALEEERLNYIHGTNLQRAKDIAFRLSSNGLRVDHLYQMVKAVTLSDDFEIDDITASAIRQINQEILKIDTG